MAVNLEALMQLTQNEIAKIPCPHRRKAGRIFFALLLVVMAFAPLRGYAQLLQGTMSGNVTDPNQAIVVGAAVTARNESTNISRSTVTNAQGEFTLPTLEPGTYTLTVKAPGFETFVKTGNVVNANENTRSDIVMAVGQVSQTVSVSAQALTLQSDRADVVTDLASTNLSSLPLPLGNDFQQQVAVVVPGVALPQSGGSFGANANRAVAITVNGVGAAANTTRVDGTSVNNFNQNSGMMYGPALDDIENVNVVTNSQDAEQGTAGGVAVNITTKSGTNDLHGSLFEFHSDRDLQAYQWNANSDLPKGEYIFNQFGGTIGGPIKKSKLFYFVSFLGTDTNVGNTLFAELPTPAMVSGDLSASPTPIYDPTTGDEADCLPGGNAKLCGTGRTPFPGNKITNIDPGVLSLFKYAAIPNPNATGSGALGLSRNYVSTGVSWERQNQIDAKVNWDPTQKLSLFARFGVDLINWADPQQFGLLGGPNYSTANSAAGTGTGPVYSGTASATYIFTPNLIADAYYGYTINASTAVPQALNQNLAFSVMAIPGLQSGNVGEGGLPGLYVDGFGGTGSNIPEATFGKSNNFEPQYYSNDEKEYAGNVTWVKGTHNFRTGISLVQQQENESFEEFTFCSYCTGAGGFQFSQGSTQLNGGPAGNDYNAWASFLLGLSSNAGQVVLEAPEYHDDQNILGIYARDRWQVNHKLTLSYGLRWDYYPFPTRGSLGMEYLDIQTNQMVICGIGGTPKNCGITKDNERFEPRGGIAYRLNDSTAIRAGYSLSTDPTNTGDVVGNRQNFPYMVTSTIPSTNSFAYATSLRQGLPTAVAPNFSSGTVDIPLTTGAYTVDNQQYARGYIQSWNLTVERQLPGWMVSVGYVGMRNIHQDATSGINENWGTIGTGSAGQAITMLTGRTASTIGLGAYGTATFDALEATATHSLSRNFQVNASYTFGKALSFAGPGIAIPSLYRLNYGNTAGVQRENAGIALILTSPFGKNQSWATGGVPAQILGNWKLETVTSLRTGSPFTVTGSNTTLNASGSTQFANCNAPKKMGIPSEWYNVSDFSEPTTGTIGNCGTDTLWGPATNTLDAALNRVFPIYREKQLEFRASMFNTPNNPHHATPTSSLTSSSFMQALGIANTGRDGVDQRTVELSLKLNF
jgi:Carboxypeptidase regulatory-like domain/TonB dependent receptor